MYLLIELLLICIVAVRLEEPKKETYLQPLWKEFNEQSPAGIRLILHVYRH